MLRDIKQHQRVPSESRRRGDDTYRGWVDAGVWSSNVECHQHHQSGDQVGHQPDEGSAGAGRGRDAVVGVVAAGRHPRAAVAARHLAERRDPRRLLPLFPRLRPVQSGAGVSVVARCVVPPRLLARRNRGRRLPALGEGRL